MSMKCSVFNAIPVVWYDIAPEIIIVSHNRAPVSYNSAVATQCGQPQLLLFIVLFIVKFYHWDRYWSRMLSLITEADQMGRRYLECSF